MSAQEKANYTPHRFLALNEKRALRRDLLIQHKQSTLQAGAHEFLAFVVFQSLGLGVGIAHFHLALLRG